MGRGAEPSGAAVACQETLLNAQDAVSATTMQLSKWGLTNDAAPLAPRALALLRRKEQGRDGTGVDKLFEAAKGGKGALSVHELAAALTKTGPESRGWSSQTALHVAARSNFVEGVKLLISHGFDIEALDGRGLTPVRVAARHGAAAAAAALIDAGAETERTTTTPTRRNAISHAVKLSRRALEVDDVGNAMTIALENVPKQPLCLEVAEMLARKGCTVPRTLATTALLLAVQNQLPCLRKAAGASIEWRGALPMVIHALESHEQWSVSELQRWLEQHAGSRNSSDSGLTAQDSEEHLRIQVKIRCQESLQHLLGPENPTAPCMTPSRSSVSDSSKGFDSFMYIPEKTPHEHRYLGKGLVRRPEGFVASPILSDTVQCTLQNQIARQRRPDQGSKRDQSEEQEEEIPPCAQIEDSDELGAASEAIHPQRTRTDEIEPEEARAKRQRVVQYVAAVEAEEAEARAAAESAAKQLVDLHNAAKAIWSPPPLPIKTGKKETASRIWEAHDGPAPVRYAKEAAAVAACRGAAARHRVLARMVTAMEQEVRERHWTATGLSGPMLRTGIYADYHELIKQSTQDDGWIVKFDSKWKQRAQAAEQAAKSNAGRDVQVIPNPDAFEKLVRDLNGHHNAEVCPWQIDMRELAGAHAQVITRPPTPSREEDTPGKEKYIEAFLNEDGRKMILPELAVRLIPAEYQTEDELQNAKPFLKTGWEKTSSSDDDVGHSCQPMLGVDPEGWEDELELEKQKEHNKKATTTTKATGSASARSSSKGGKGWKILRRTVEEETSSGNNWREWEREPDYEGYDAVKVKNIHGDLVGLEGGWDGRQLGLGGGTKEQMEMARKWKKQTIEKRRGKPTNSFFGNEIGSSRANQPPSPDSPAIIANKWARKAAEERRKAAAATKEQEFIDSWGGMPPSLSEQSAVAELRKDRSNRKKQRGKGVKGTGAPPEGMFMVDHSIKTTTGPHDPSDTEGGATDLGWLHKGDVVAITKMEGLTSGAVVGRVAGANRGWVVVLDQYGKTKLTRIPRPTALERAQYEVEKHELVDMQARLAKSDAGAGAVRRQAIADAAVKADTLRIRIAELEDKIQASSALGRRRTRYKRELRELDHELERIEADKRNMENGGTMRRMLVEEISCQEKIVNDLRIRVEAEDNLLKLQNVAKIERKRARKEEKLRAAEAARQQEENELTLIKQRQARKQLAHLGISVTSPTGTQRMETARSQFLHYRVAEKTDLRAVGSPHPVAPDDTIPVEKMAHKRRGAVVGSSVFASTQELNGSPPPPPNLRRRGAVTDLLPLTIPSPAALSVVNSSLQSNQSSALSHLGLSGAALSVDGMEAALRIARSYPTDRFDEILIRELGKRSKEVAEDAARAEHAAQMERFRMQNRLTHELAHEGLARDVRRWDTSAALKWLAAIGLQGAQVAAVVHTHGLDGDGLLFSDPAVLGRLFRPAWLYAGVPELQVGTRVKALINALDYLRTEVAGLPRWTAKVELAAKKELDYWDRIRSE